MTDLSFLWRGLDDQAGTGALGQWLAAVPPRVQALLAARPHGELSQWLELVTGLPRVSPSAIELNSPAVTVGAADDLAAPARTDLEQRLRALHPWRKGPFELFGIHIDAEWRSDMKWARLAGEIAPLRSRRVLDVGCGNGYYALRMAGAGARQVIGVDPTWRYVMQFAALRNYLNALPVHVLPLGIDDVPPGLAAFDTVFSMGVLYHRRAPLDHLSVLRDLLRPGGELVLETLVVEGDENTVLLPPGRYAKMRNVWFLPSVAALERWLRRCGFSAVRTVDVAVTTTDEQRRTDWMQFHSLADFLDPVDATRTVEGLPAPRRALALATRP